MPTASAKPRQFTALIEREGDGFVSLCPAVELFLEAADPGEIEERPHSEVYVTHFALAVG